MNEEEIKKKAAALAELFAAWAAGKTLQFNDPTIGWTDYGDSLGPTMQVNLSRWRVKQEPRRMWTREDGEDTRWEERAAEWKRQGYTVTEWQEVLPE